MTSVSNRLESRNVTACGREHPFASEVCCQNAEISDKGHCDYWHHGSIV